ncbi:unnamed protein product [Microthlaspi erraticum]|uniref:C-JID domain-containing protein n=1 Tax=Microthlaspi erraticum TaxID=1685480 RepID=A0A6D2IMD9_9BRAS|nr:unnamed protein product [Microthlaspi erraticum]
MGREVVREQSSNPGKREFLVDSADICDVLEENTGTHRLLGISLDIDEIDELHIHESAFRKMRNLRFLKIFTNTYMFEKKAKLHLPDSFDYLPPKLKLLWWDGCPMKSMPSDFCPEKLVKLTMKNSKLKKLWEGSRKLTCLKEVNLWGSENLRAIPDLSRAINLEKIYLGFRLSWVQRPSPIRKFNNLKNIGMLECDNLETRQTSINLESPKRLNLRESSLLCLENVANFCMENFKIEKLWEGMQPLIRMGTTLPASLTVLFLSDITDMVELPFSIQNLNKLTDLRITRCINLQTLPNGINLESLQRLNLNGCSRLRTFPDISRNISSLYLEETAIEEVPWWVEHFSKLKYLVMQRCSKLQFVYLNLSKMKHLELVNFSHCGALTGAEWNGYPSGLEIEAETTDTELLAPQPQVASSSLPDDYVSKVHFSFVDCFNLDLEALLQQISFEKLIVSGDKVPLYFTHQTTGNSLAISLLKTRFLQPFLKFRAGAVFVFSSLSKFGANGVWINVHCRFKGRLGNNYFDSTYQKEYFSVNQKGSHLFIFDCHIPVNSQNDLLSDEVDVQFHFSCDASCKMKGWGIRLSENCSSPENRLGNPNTLPLVCESIVLKEGEQGEETERSSR